MRVGARIIKTGIALILALLVCKWLKLNPPVIAAIAATLSIQPTLYRTWKQLREQLEANAIGAVIGVIATYFLGAQPLIVGLVVMIVILINLRLKLEDSLVLSIITVIAVMEVSTGNNLQLAWNRFFLTVIGILSAAIVNAVFIPPHYEKRLFNEVSELTDKLSFMLRTLVHNEMEEKAFRKEKNEAKSAFKSIEQIYDLYIEERTRFRKVTYSGSKKLVLFKQMVTVLYKEMDMLRTFERHIYSSFTNEHYLFPMIKHQLVELTDYHKNILMTYSGVLKTKETWQLPEPIIEENDRVLHEFMLLYKEVKSTPEEQDDGQWKHLFPIVAEIFEYANQLEHLNKLVHTFHTHQSEED
ncbi:FUSC family protein [Aneurinibacillus tyrosinisolvens]|uniref:FUSC family protein n=1 Tax=Aneurinibacillus tyrosinisolvens TaxID=1443435 RepID=UPI00063F566C|nr:aromatic acid exporter family protein [Aneurinibacillus tyrosinisolvens]